MPGRTQAFAARCLLGACSTRPTPGSTREAGRGYRRVDSNRVHLVSRFAPSDSAPDGYPETGSEGESLTTPSESVASGPRP
jgi:hypothetical protein